MSGKRPEALQFELPDETIVYILDLFYSLKGQAGTKISFSEVKAYCEVMAVNLASYEIEVIMKIDDIFEGSI